MNKNPFTYDEFRNIYSKVPRLTIDPIVRSENGIVLTLRKAGFGWVNMWHLPGGTLFYKETVEQGLRRITKDEIGAEVNIVKLLGYMEFPSEEKERGFGWTVSLGILCDLVSGDLVPDENASDVKIFAELPENTVAEQKAFLQTHWKEISENRF